MEEGGEGEVRPSLKFAHHPMKRKAKEADVSHFVLDHTPLKITVVLVLQVWLDGRAALGG